MQRHLLGTRASASGARRRGAGGWRRAEIYADIAAAAGVPYEGKVFKTVLFDNTKKSDAIHPNAAGYRMIAVALAQRLHDSGAIQLD